MQVIPLMPAKRLRTRRAGAAPKNDLLGVLREEILAAMAKHILIERDNVQVRMDRGDTLSTLEIDVEIQHQTRSSPCPGPAGRPKTPRDPRGAGARERILDL